MIETSLPTIIRLKGRWLMLARGFWIFLALVAVVFLMIGLTGLYFRWSIPCQAIAPQDQAACINQEQALWQFGLSRNFYAFYFPLGVLVEVLPWFFAGVLIFWKKSDQPFEYLFSMMLVVAGTISLDEGVSETVVYLYPALWPVLRGMFFVGGSLLVLWYCFPDGRFAPRWLMWITVLVVVFEIGRQFFYDTYLNFFNWPSPFPDGINIFFGYSIVYSLVHRYRNTSDRVQIQQIKWVVLSVSILSLLKMFQSLVNVLIQFGLLSWNEKNAIFWNLTWQPLLYLSLVFVAVSLVFSILRYRLWDIDFLINRSLVYGTLSVLLVALLAGALFIVSQLFQNFTGGPMLAVAGSAAVFGAIFQPARRQVQRYVDRRFYHIEIDYQKISPALAVNGIMPVANFGTYQNLEMVGRGGMAEVYKSAHPSTGEPVAIKILPAALSAELEFRKRFAREIQVVTALIHPNIVRMLESGEQDGRLYIVMEYLAGKDLDQLIKSGGRLSLVQTQALLQQLASALDYAHSEGFVHRDIKPANVLLGPASHNGMRAVLTDFGIAKISNAHTVITSTGLMLGTFGYVAPEQIQESSHVDGAADIYALGVMAYQMLTGELPFKHGNAGALLIAHLTQPPPDACELAPELPRCAGAAIQRAMAKKPEERFATASAFAQSLAG